MSLYGDPDSGAYADNRVRKSWSDYGDSSDFQTFRCTIEWVGSAMPWQFTFFDAVENKSVKWRCSRLITAVKWMLRFCRAWLDRADSRTVHGRKIRRGFRS